MKWTPDGRPWQRCAKLTGPLSLHGPGNHSGCETALSNPEDMAPRPWPVLNRYSYLSAIIGSTRVALRAGRNDAQKATIASSHPTAMNVIGSVELTPNRTLDITRVRANAPTAPAMTPIR